jgi:putative membrane protein
MLQRWSEHLLVVVGDVVPKLTPVRALLTATAFVPALVGPVMAQGERYFRRAPFGPWAWTFGLIMLFRLLIIVALVAVVWRLLSSRGPFHASDSAVQILRDRYARGEISEDEYRKRLAMLTS